MYDHTHRSYTRYGSYDDGSLPGGCRLYILMTCMPVVPLGKGQVEEKALFWAMAEEDGARIRDAFRLAYTSQ